MSTNLEKSSNFRESAALVGLVRQAISAMSGAVPDLSDELFQEWLMRYREAAGERTTDSVYSFAKMQFDKHFAQFRAQYPKVLGQYLISQLDRAQGREAAWPTLDSESPELVSDLVMERRMAVENLTRLVDVEADEGVRTFDVLLAEALGCSFKSLRDNPMRPAVFFHTLGLTWTQVSGSERDELFMLTNYAPLFGPRVAGLYPAMTKVLREHLGRPKAGGLNMLMASEGGTLYERRRQVPAAPAKPDPASAGANPQAPSPSATAGESDLPDPWGRRTSDGALSSDHIEVLLKRVDAVAARLEPAIACEELPESIRLMLARVQAAAARRFMVSPGLAATREHPFWKLMKDIGDVAAWKKLPAGHKKMPALLMHLNIVREMLARDRSGSSAGKDDEALMFDHLDSQFLSLRSTPAATYEPATEQPPDAASRAANDARGAALLARAS